MTSAKSPLCKRLSFSFSSVPPPLPEGADGAGVLQAPKAAGVRPVPATVQPPGRRAPALPLRLLRGREAVRPGPGSHPPQLALQLTPAARLPGPNGVFHAVTKGGKISRTTTRFLKEQQIDSPWDYHDFLWLFRRSWEPAVNTVFLRTWVLLRKRGKQTIFCSLDRGHARLICWPDDSRLLKCMCNIF